MRKYLKRPQLLTSSRHITQGAAEISGMSWSGNVLDICAELVEDDLYTVKIYVPAGYSVKSYEGFECVKMISERVCEAELMPMENKRYNLRVEFEIQ